MMELIITSSRMNDNLFKNRKCILIIGSFVEPHEVSRGIMYGE